MKEIEKDPHCFGHRKIVGVPYCCGCGLMLLKNDATREAVRLGCGYKEILRARGRKA